MPEQSTRYLGSASYRMNVSVFACGLGWLMIAMGWLTDLVIPEPVFFWECMLFWGCTALAALAVAFSGYRMLIKRGKDCSQYHMPHQGSIPKFLILIVTFSVSVISLWISFMLCVYTLISKGFFTEKILVSTLVALFTIRVIYSALAFIKMLKLDNQYWLELQRKSEQEV